jgi:hypothetical protein
MSPEHKANWLAAVRKSNNRPASGMPPSGMPASGTPAGGAGKGGARNPQKPTRGRGAKAKPNLPDNSIPPFDAANAAIMGRIGAAIANLPEGRERAELTRAANAFERSPAVREKLRSVDEYMLELDALIDGAKFEATKFQALREMLNRLSGMPTQRIDANIRRTAADFSDEELAAIAGIGGGEEGDSEEGGGAE